MRALLVKELRQHWLAFTGMALLQAVALSAVLLLMMRGGMTVSAFDPLRFVIGWFGAAGAMMLGHRLIAAEYSARTQLFLEALPLRRSTMLAAKVLLVLAVVLASSIVLVGLAALVGWRHEHLTPKFAGLLLLRVSVWNACASLFFCVLGLLGRYRWPVLVATGLFLVSAEQWLGLDPAKWPPFSLLGQSFSSERHLLPVDELRGAGLFLAACLGIGTLLGLVSEGQVAGLLAEKMSRREKVFVWIVAVALLGVIATKSETPPPRFTLAGASQARHGVAEVNVAPAGEPAQRTADTVAQALDGLADYLGWSDLPVVLITLGGELDARTWQVGTHKDARRQGLPVRANFNHPEFDPRAFTAWLIPEVVRGATLGRAAHEPQRWALDGMGHFWMQREASEDRTAALQRQALWAAPDGVTAGAVRAWFLRRDRIGSDAAAGLSWSGLRTIESKAGPEACRQLLVSLLRPPPRKDIRTTIATLWNPASARLRRHTGWSLDTFADHWSKTLEDWRPIHADALARVPRLQVEFRFLSDGPGAAVAQARVVAPDPSLSSLELTFANLEPADSEIPAHWIDSVTLPADGEWHLAASSLLPGQRWAGTLVHWSPELECRIISGWQRLTVHPEPAPASTAAP